MSISEYIPRRMKQIMNEKGLENTDFIRAEGDLSEENLSRLTSSRFYDVLNGENKNPKIDFIQNFCDLAGITIETFFCEEKDELELSLTEEEKELIRIHRKIKRPLKKHLTRYLDLLMDMQEGK